LHQIAQTMIQHGWNDRPPPGRQVLGTVIHKDQITAIMQSGAESRLEQDPTIGRVPQHD